MNTAAGPPTDLVALVRQVKGPRPVLSREAERDLTARQRELLDELHDVLADGFSHLTMADLAATLSCSLRTLYGLAPSRDQLVLMVVDRNLWRIGRLAMAAIEADMGPLDALRAYLRAANVAVADTTEAYAADAAADPDTRSLQASHSQYLIDITHAVLDCAVTRGDIDDIDTSAVARVIAGLGADLASPDVLPTLRSSPADAANAVVDLLLRGLTDTKPRNPTPCT